MQLDLAPQPKVGECNGRFLGLLANGVSAATLRARWKAGEFPGLSPSIARENLTFHGLTRKSLKQGNEG